LSDTPTGHDLALALSGGNALGAYHGGVYEALHDRGLEPDRVAGASAGAIVGALICGNRRDERLAALRSFWRPASGPPLFTAGETMRRSAAAATAAAAGRPGLFTPRAMTMNMEPPSLYDTTPLARSLEQSIDFDRLNSGSPRFTATAVDLESGEDVMFDTAHDPLSIAHLRASCALPPAFPPQWIGGRLIADAGVSANLPLDAVLADPLERPLLCIAIDLLPLHRPAPATVTEAAERMQDLIFATQSRRAIAAWQAVFDERTRRGDAASVTLLHIAYTDQDEEVVGKAFDFSPESVRARWLSGQRDMQRALADLDAGCIAIGEPGMTVYAADPAASGQRFLRKVRNDLAPRTFRPAG